MTDLADSAIVGEHDAGAPPIPIHANLTMYATILEPSHVVRHTLRRNGAYLHLVMRSGAAGGGAVKGARLNVNGAETIVEGDGLYIRGSGNLEIESVGGTDAEFLLFDLQI